MAWKKAEEEKRKAEEEKMRQEKEHKEAQEKFDSLFLLNLYERYDTCLLGGINEIWMEHSSYTEVPAHLKEAVDSCGRNGLILTPGCCILLETPQENLLAASIAARRF